MTTPTLPYEFSVVIERIQFVSAEFSSRDPALSASLNGLIPNLQSLYGQLDNAYNFWLDQQQGESIEPINTAAQDAFNQIINTIIGTGVTRFVGILPGLVYDAHSSFIDWTGISFIKFNKDVISSNNSGHDFMFGANAGANYNLGNGNDTYVGRGFGFPSYVLGGAGNDTIVGGDSGDELYGDAGNDVIYTGISGGFAHGGANNDKIIGDVSSDTLIGGVGEDVLFGHGGDDILAAVEINNYTTALDDDLVGGSGADTIYGSGGNNAIFGDNITDFSGITAWFSELADLETKITHANISDLGVGGNDLIRAGNGSDFVSGGFGNDIIHGDAGNDYLFGDEGQDNLFGGAGNDVLFGGEHADVLNGGADYDIAAYWFSEAGITINMNIPALSTGDAAGDTFISIEEVQGTFHNDNIVGNDTVRRLVGDDGNDTLISGSLSNDIYGDDGEDILSGVSAAERAAINLDEELPTSVRSYLYGGAGNDTFQFMADGSTGGHVEIDQIRGDDGYIYPVGETLGLERWENTDVIMDFSAGDKLVTLSGDLNNGLELNGLDVKYSELFPGQSGNWFDFVDSDGERTGLGISQQGANAYVFYFYDGGELDRSEFFAEAVIQNFSVLTNFSLVA